MTKAISAVFIFYILICLAGGSYAVERTVEDRMSHLSRMALSEETVSPVGLILAANEQSSEPSPADSENKEKTEATEEKAEPAKPAPKPRKSFTPSEKVKAGQSVDFPYDI